MVYLSQGDLRSSRDRSLVGRTAPASCEAHLVGVVTQSPLITCRRQPGQLIPVLAEGSECSFHCCLQDVREGFLLRTFRQLVYPQWRHALDRLVSKFEPRFLQYLQWRRDEFADSSQRIFDIVRAQQGATLPR